MVRMVSFMLRIFYHNKERHWRRLVRNITLVAARFGGAGWGQRGPGGVSLSASAAAKVAAGS